MNQPFYTKEQWDMTNQVMNLVDEQRHGSKAPWSESDTNKVMELVQRTYRDQGIDVDQAVVEKAMTVAIRGLHLQEMDSPLSLTGDTPIDEAKARIRQALSHRLYSDYDLASLIQSEGTRLRKKSTGLWLKQIGQVAALLIAMFFTFRAILSQPNPMVMLAAVVAILGFCGYTIKVFSERGMELSKTVRLNNAQASALKDLSRPFYNSNDLRTWALHINPTLGYHSLEPVADTSFWWKEADQYAQAHPALFKMWGEWLTSRAPIRQGDVMLLREAAEAVEKAEKFVDYHVHQIQAQAQAKHRMLSGRQ